MSDDTLDKIHTSIESGLIVYPRFEQTDTASMNNLKQAIINAMEDYQKKKKKPDPNSPESKATNAMNESAKAMNQTAEQMKKEMEKRIKEDRKRELEEKKKQEREKSFENKFKQIQEELAGKFSANTKLAFRLASDGIKQAIKFYSTLYVSQSEQVAKLSVAGISSNKSVVLELKNLVRETGMTREAIISYLGNNSQIIAGLRRFGGNALAKSSSALAGANSIRGMTHDEAMSATSLFLENLNEFNNGYRISIDDIYTSSQKAAESLKMLSLATGKSVEQITQEIKAREKTLLNKRLSSDNKTKFMYQALSSIGLDDDLIQYVLTGKASETVARNMSTPEGRNLLLNLRQLQLNSGGNSDAIRQGISNLSNSSTMRNYLQRFKNVSNTLLAYDGGLHQSLFGLENLKNFNEISMNLKDAENIENLKKFRTELEKLMDSIKNPNISTESLSNITKLMGKGIEFFNTLAEKYPNIAGYVHIISQMPSMGLLGGYISYKFLVKAVGLVGNIGKMTYKFITYIPKLKEVITGLSIIPKVSGWFKALKNSLSLSNIGVKGMIASLSKFVLIGYLVAQSIHLFESAIRLLMYGIFKAIHWGRSNLPSWLGGYDNDKEKLLHEKRLNDYKVMDTYTSKFVPGMVKYSKDNGWGMSSGVLGDAFGKTQSFNTSTNTTTNTTTTSPSPTLNVSSNNDEISLLREACNLLGKIVDNTANSNHFVASTSYS